MLQTLFSLYLHNQWTNFHKLSCARKLQMMAIKHMQDVQKQQQTTKISGHQ